MHRKQGQKPHRIALRCAGGACSFSAFSFHPLRLRDRRRAGPVPQIQTNSSGSYRRSNKCRTFTFSSEGSATVCPPPPPPSVTNHPFVPPPQSPRFSTISLFLQCSSLSSLARVPVRGSRSVTRAHVYAALLCTMVSPVQSTVSSAPGFLALANFPLLNVNFDVIDGAATAWMLAYSLCPLPYSLYHYLRRIWPYSWNFYCSLIYINLFS